MLAYISLLNKSVTEDERKPNSKVEDAAQKIASLCLAENFQPTDIERKETIEAIGEGGEWMLEYLQKRLQIVAISGVRENRVRFQLDPLAEYLAAIDACRRFGGDKRRWSRYLGKLKPKAKDAREFLLALEDCARNAKLGYATPAFVADELKSLASPLLVEEGMTIAESNPAK